MLKIAITTIGSGVGQSIVDSCRDSQLSMKIYGLGMNPLGYGAFDCDERLELPGIYAENYVDELLKYCKEYKFDMLIPALDDELGPVALRMSEFEALGVQVPVSQPEFISLCRDKGLMSRELLAYSPAFVESFTQEYAIANPDNLPYPLIAKPNSGFASRNMFVINSKKDLERLEPFHVIQTLAIPKEGSINRKAFLNGLKEGNILQVDEISVQLLYGKNGEELGRMASFNKLQNGIPIEIIPIEDVKLWEELDLVLNHLKALGLSGPLNIQGRLTDNGFKIFEMNPRFTGITGLRSLMGFNEVEAIIKNYCNLKSNNEPLRINNRKIGIRQVKSRVIDVARDKDLNQAVKRVEEFPKQSEEKLSILVTEANGYFAFETLKQLRALDCVKNIKVLVKNAEEFNSTDYFPKDVIIYDREDFESGNLALGAVDIVCHFPSVEESGSREELEFINKLMLAITQHQVPALINISSAEETSLTQNNLAVELMTQNTKAINKITSNISVRVAELVWASKSMEIETFAHRSVQDASRAIVKLIEMPHENWSKNLNLESEKVELREKSFSEYV